MALNDERETLPDDHRYFGVQNRISCLLARCELSLNKCRFLGEKVKAIYHTLHFPGREGIGIPDRDTRRLSCVKDFEERMPVVPFGRGSSNLPAETDLPYI